MLGSLWKPWKHFLCSLRRRPSDGRVERHPKGYEGVLKMASAAERPVERCTVPLEFCFQAGDLGSEDETHLM